MSPRFSLRLAQVTFVLAWSSGWVSAEVAIRYADTVTILALRFLLGSLLVAIFLLFRQRSSRPLTRRRLMNAAIVGVLSQAIWLGAVMEAQRYGVSPGLNALINGLQPLLTAALLPLVLGRRPPAMVFLGILTSLGGVLLVVWDEIRLGGSSPAAYFIPLVSVGAMTIAVLLERLSSYYDQDAQEPQGSGPSERGLILLVQFLASGIVTLMLFPLFGSTNIDWQPLFVISLLWLILVPQIASYALLWYLVYRTSPDEASALFLASPPTTLILSLILFGDPISLIEALGSAIVLFGLYFGLRSATMAKRKEQKESGEV